MFSRSFDQTRKTEPQPAGPTVNGQHGPAMAPSETGVGPAVGQMNRMAPAVAPAGTVVSGADARPGAGKVSVIGNDLTILGQGITIISKGSLQLDGAIQGNLHGTEILVGEKGRVDGTIAAESVVIRGTVNGTIKALRVALQEGAHVEGEILHQTLTLDAKAHFEGRVRRPQNTDELMPNLDPAAHETKPGGA